MPIGTLLTLPCTITHVTQDGAPDDYGNPTEQTTTSVTVCYLQKQLTAGQDEDTLGVLATSDWLLVLPASDVVDHGDRVTVTGYGTFEVFGEPAPTWNPRARSTHHVELRVRRTV